MATKIKSKFLSIMLVLTIVFAIPMSVYAEEVADLPIPKLTSISFKNATIDQEFDPNISEYTITLDDPNIAPTLKEKTIEGDAKLFITYNLDVAGKQTGVKATLKYSNISMEYNFAYSNPSASEITSNNKLGYVTCDLCEIYPKLNDKQTNYTLYIPNDLTEITLEAGTQDPNAKCKVPGTITLNNDQELTIKLDVSASDGTIRTYNFKVERLDLTIDEVKNMPDSESLVKDKVTNEKLEIILIVLAVLIGIIALIIFIILAKKLTVKVYDEDDIDFFTIENDEKSDDEEE